MDAAKLAAMKEKNAAKLKELDEKVKDAEENLGETEVRDALLAKADYLAQIGDKAGAVAAYKVTEGKTTGSGNKVDYVFSQIRYGVGSTLASLGLGRGQNHAVRHRFESGICIVRSLLHTFGAAWVIYACVSISIGC